MIKEPVAAQELCWIKKAKKHEYTIGPYHKKGEYVIILFLRQHLMLLLKRYFGLITVQIQCIIIV